MFFVGKNRSEIAEQCPHGFRVILPYPFQWNLCRAECPVLEPVPTFGFFGIVGAVIQLDGKEYPEILIADHEIHMLLGDQTEIFHIAAFAGDCHQIF